MAISLKPLSIKRVLGVQENLAPSEPSPVITWSPFTLTPGTTTEWVGYTNGDIASPPYNPPVGLISNQPTNLADLAAIYQDSDMSTIVVVFSGDQTQKLGVLTLQVDDFPITSPTHEYIGGFTYTRFNAYGGPDFVDGVELAVELENEIL